MTSESSSSSDPSGFNTVFRLFIIPLLIVIVSVGLFYAFGLLTFETKKPEDYLAEIKTGGDSKKWQAAYSLAGLLVTEKNLPEDTRKDFTREIISLFQNKARYNVQVRSYLALALGYLKQKESTPVLTEALTDSSEDVVLYSVWALAIIGDPQSYQDLLPLMNDPRPAIRKITAFALGALSNPRAIPALKQVLTDSSPDVSWNAALSLAALNDASGVSVLEKLLDRGYLDGFPKLKEREKEGIMINAIQSLAKIQWKNARSRIEKLSEKDASLKVRQAALMALARL